MGATQAVSEWITRTNFAAIPQEAKKIAEVACFDCLGVMLAGSAQPHGKIFLRYIEDLGGKAEATIIPLGLRVSAAHAALAMGTLSHSLDYDDSGAFAHASTVLFPALLALGDKTGASGKDLIEAYVVGFEVGVRLASPYKQSRGFHKMAAFGRMAAAAACAKLLKLNSHQVQMALGIAGSMASGVVLNHGTMTKPLHAGLAARDGVMAAELASRGWTAAEDIIDHPLGFIPSFCGDAGNIDDTVKSLGNPFTIHNTIIIKKYPCGAGNHPTIDSLLALMTEHGFDYQDVEEVELQQSYQSDYVLYAKPRTGLEGKFSVLYNAAAALVQGKVDIDTFTDERVKDPRIQETMDKVRIRILTRWDEWEEKSSGRWPGGSTGFTGKPVRVRLKDGRVLTKTLSPKQILGSPRNPWPEENIRLKFEANAGLILSSQKTQQAIESWSRLSEVENLQKAIPTVVG
ncbi:MAG: MmgE/PrpD family protein [Candidatus Binatia bacterium]